MIFLINDDVTGLILRIKGMGAYILHFVAAIIASALKKADNSLNFMLLRAPSQTTPNTK